ncbi:MAG: flagellin [bacterium]
MAMTVNTNISSLIAQRNLQKTSNSLSRSVERLTSGLRINRAADDAAGLALSTSMKAQIRSINQAVRNANDAVSLLQTAEGGLSEMSNILLRMRELAEQAANESLGQEERQYLNDEYLSLKSEITRISDVTEFAGKKLLDGTISSGVNFQVGFKNSTQNRLSFSMSDTDAAALGLNTANANSISTASLAQSALAVIDASAITVLSERRGDIGALQNRLEYTIANLQSSSENFSAANSRIEDADFAYETAVYVKNQILMQAGTSVLAQANVLPQQALTLLG